MKPEESSMMASTAPLSIRAEDREAMGAVKEGILGDRVVKEDILEVGVDRAGILVVEADRVGRVVKEGTLVEDREDILEVVVVKEGILEVEAARAGPKGTSTSLAAPEFGNNLFLM